MIRNSHLQRSSANYNKSKHGLPHEISEVLLYDNKKTLESFTTTRLVIRKGGATLDSSAYRRYSHQVYQ